MTWLHCTVQVGFDLSVLVGLVGLGTSQCRPGGSGYQAAVAILIKGLHSSPTPGASKASFFSLQAACSRRPKPD